jgi:hypothetical protein
MKTQEIIAPSFMAKIAMVSEEFLSDTVRNMYATYGNTRPISDLTIKVYLHRAAKEAFDIDVSSDEKYVRLFRRIESFMDKTNIFQRGTDGYLLVESPAKLVK